MQPGRFLAPGRHHLSWLRAPTGSHYLGNGCLYSPNHAGEPVLGWQHSRRLFKTLSTHTHTPRYIHCPSPSSVTEHVPSWLLQSTWLQNQAHMHQERTSCGVFNHHTEVTQPSYKHPNMGAERGSYSDSIFVGPEDSEIHFLCEFSASQEKKTQGCSYWILQ